MQVSNVKDTSFGIKFHPSLKREAARLFVGNNGSQEQFNRFYRKMCYMKKNYGYDNYTIVPHTKTEGGYDRTAIYAVPDEGTQGKKVCLFVKDNFRQVFERIIHMNEDFLARKLGTP